MSSVAAAPSIGSQTPRIHVVPPYVSSAGQEAIEVAEVAGLHLDPWEKLVLVDALGETAAQRWAAFRVGLEVARQNGKGAILEARELAGLFAFGERVIVHSAHEQATASEHFRRLLTLMEGVPDFDRRIRKVVRGKGSEAIELLDGARIFFKTRTGGGGRGFTGNLVVFDEAMMLAAAFMAALVPVMAAMSMLGDPQLWFVGSAVDQEKHDHGVEFARVRHDALKGNDPRLAYFGWNAPFDHPDQVPEGALDDPGMWAAANPGMGIRISPGYIADERRALGHREFCVERLGVGDWPSTDTAAQAVIPLETWRGLADRASRAADPVCFAVDVRPDGSSSTIAAAGRRADGLVHGEIVDKRPGTLWVPGRLAELTGRHGNVGVIVDPKSPASAMLPRLTELGDRVHGVTGTELAQACAMLLAGCENGTFRHLGTPELEAAVRGAAKRLIGDGGAWAWSRKSSAVDISPLVALTLAAWGFETRKPAGPPRLINLEEIED